MLSSLLKVLADQHSPRLVLSLRPQDPLPEWITHLVILGPKLRVQEYGWRSEILKETTTEPMDQLDDTNLASSRKSDPTPALEASEQKSSGHAIHQSQITHQPDQVVSHMAQRELLIQMNGVRLSYGETNVLGGWKQDVDGEEREGLWWQVARGDRWGIFGANGK